MGLSNAFPSRVRVSNLALHIEKVMMPVTFTVPLYLRKVGQSVWICNEVVLAANLFRVLRVRPLPKLLSGAMETRGKMLLMCYLLLSLYQALRIWHTSRLYLFTSRAAAGLIEVWVQEGTTFAFWHYSFALKVILFLITIIYQYFHIISVPCECCWLLGHT